MTVSDIVTSSGAKSGQQLALRGGTKTIPADPPNLFKWPIITQEDEAAVLEVLRAGNMSGTNISRLFEQEWGHFLGTQFNLAHCNGTCALLAAMFGVGVGRGDEIICPSITYWASAFPAFLLGASVVFADVHPETYCIDPADIEHRITPRTKAIVIVHYCGHPADMDPIMDLARRHRLKVIEDASHAHGALYKGRMTGTLGDVAAFSMMAGKSFPIGEGGMLSTNDRTIFERAIAFCHYERIRTDITDPALKAIVGPPGFPSGLPLAGIKGRINQTCSAMGRVQLKYYPQRMAEIQRALNRFWDLLEAGGGTPGLRAHRPAKDSGSTMGGWYNPIGHYLPEELGGLPVEKFIEACNAEGAKSNRGVNMPLHLHPVTNEADLFHDGKPTRIAFADRDLRQPRGSLPVAEGLAARSIGLPWFKKDSPEEIAKYAAAWRKVASNYRQLL